MFSEERRHPDGTEDTEERMPSWSSAFPGRKRNAVILTATNGKNVPSWSSAFWKDSEN